MLALNTPRALLMTATPHRGQGVAVPGAAAPGRPGGLPGGREQQGAVAQRQAGPGPLPAPDEGGPRRLRRDDQALQGPARREPAGAAVAGREPSSTPRRSTSSTGTSRRSPCRSGRWSTASAPPPASAPLAETLKRRRDGMGSAMPSAAAHRRRPRRRRPRHAPTRPASSTRARSPRRPRSARSTRCSPGWSRSSTTRSCPCPSGTRSSLTCLGRNGIKPGNGEQAVVFTEYADTADWLVQPARARRVHRPPVLRHGTTTTSATTPATRSPAATSRSSSAPTPATRASTCRPRTSSSTTTSPGRSSAWSSAWAASTASARPATSSSTTSSPPTPARATCWRSCSATSSPPRTSSKAGCSTASASSGSSSDSPTTTSSRVLADTFGDDEQRARALAAVGAVTASRLADAAKRADEQERALKTSVDIAQAVTALQDEQLDRINPAIVEAFLHRAADGGAITISPHAAGDGMFTLALPDGQPLPPEFAPPGQRKAGATALVATSGKSLAARPRQRRRRRGRRQPRPERPAVQGARRAVRRRPRPRDVPRRRARRRRPAAPTTTCSPTRPTSPRPAAAARAPGPAWSASTAPAPAPSGGRRSPTSRPPTPPPARRTPAAPTTPPPAPRWPPTRSRPAAPAPSTTGSASPRRELDLLPNELTNDIADRDTRIAEREPAQGT